MELTNQKKLVKHIFRLLKVNEIVIPIGRTNKGNLGLKFTENSEDFEIYLDAVPLPTKDMLVDDNNIELKKMLEKYLFEQVVQFYPDTQKGFEVLDVVDNGTVYASTSKVLDTAGNDITDKVLGKKKGGRPKGSRNRPKLNNNDSQTKV